MASSIRNIAIIAHVDHGKTTLLDALLAQSGVLGERFGPVERVMDSNTLEKERGITIISKNTSISWQDYTINVVDTPGHADFGGEVERVLSMVDSVLLLVDAVEGPMPQTAFVTRKAFAHNLHPIVVVNKIDRDGARPDWVINETFDLFARLEASDEQLDFPVVYASAINGYAGLEQDVRDGDMAPLFDTIVNHCPAPTVTEGGALQMRISTLDYDSFVGAIAVGRINRGVLKRNQQVTVIEPDGNTRKEKISGVYHFNGLKRVESEQAEAGDIVAITGISRPNVSDTITDINTPEALPALAVDEPTVSMMFTINTSPFAGRDGKYLTSRQIRERLDKELIYNVALKVEADEQSDKFRVSGRGELHLAVLIETMRREGFELAVSKPRVIVREIDGVKQEPYESLTVDVDEQHQGKLMEILGERRGKPQNMESDGRGRIRLEYIIPSRALIGFQSDFMMMTSGSGLLYHSFDHYGTYIEQDIGKRKNGAMISNAKGKASAYSLFNLQDRGRLFVTHGDDIYEGQIIGLHSRDNDLVVNPTKAKQLTNVRAAGTDENLLLTPPIKLTLERALELIEDDELVEITPAYVRLRKEILSESDRKRDRR
jgi:GTP-binding protein